WCLTLAEIPDNVIGVAAAPVPVVAESPSDGVTMDASSWNTPGLSGPAVTSPPTVCDDEIASFCTVIVMGAALVTLTVDVAAGLAPAAPAAAGGGKSKRLSE